MFFDPGITDVLRGMLPGLGNFFLIITQFGSELIFIGILLILYWTVNKEEAVMATYVLVAAVLTNYWLKYFIAKERPPVSNWYPGSAGDATNYSTPSGHSQFSATLYGWFAARSKKRWVTLIAIVLIALIGISRIYLGVHFLEDVLLGWGLGILTVVVFYYLEKPARTYLSRYDQEHLLIGLVMIGLLMTVFASLLPEPPNDNFGAMGGLTIGVALGLALERRFVSFDVSPPKGQRWRLVLRAVLGLVLVIAVMLGLEPFLPTMNIWLRAVRYTLTALSGVFVWPAIFKKINL
jgi:membrane-associated phospholipid phosphatase